MERQQQIINKILHKFTDREFGIEKFDDETFDIIDRTLIGKAKIGSIKITGKGEVSIRLQGESKKQAKFKQLMDKTSLKYKMTANAGTVGMAVQHLITDYKKAKKEIYSMNESTMTVTRDQLEKVIDDYLFHLEQYGEDIPASLPDLIAFVANGLNMSEDEVDEKFGNVLSNVINYNEDRYLNAMDKTFFESELKSDFRNFLQESKEDIITKIRSNREYRAFRNLPVYVDGDEEEKYQRLWRFVVKTFGPEFSNEEELSKVCHEIAKLDEESF